MPQKLGQHFLKNKLVLKKIVDALAPEKNDAVIEIGPGHGELTDFILERNATIIAIERDPELVSYLENKFQVKKTDPETISKIRELKTINLIEGNGLKILPEIVAALSSGASGYKIAGNIPYYITGHLLRVIGELKHKPSKTTLLIQNEVAERVCAKSPDSSLLSLSVQFWAEPKIIASVPASDFFPPPKVESAIITLTTRSENDRKETYAGKYYAFIKKAFKQPRKTLINNLLSGGVDKETAISIINNLGLKVNSRPQELSVSAIINSTLLY